MVLVLVNHGLCGSCRSLAIIMLIGSDVPQNQLISRLPTSFREWCKEIRHCVGDQCMGIKSEFGIVVLSISTEKQEFVGGNDFVDAQVHESVLPQLI